MWPDCSENGLGDAHAEMTGQLAALESCLASPDPVPRWAERLDLRLAAGYLRTQLWELGSRHFQRGNPSFYSGEAAFGLISLFLTDFAPLGERVGSAVKRLQGLGPFLDGARAHLQSAPEPWTERALRECRGTQALLGDGMDRLMAGWPAGALSETTWTALEEARREAARGVADFERTLRQDVEVAPMSQCAAGEEALRLYLEHGHFIDEDPREIVRYAEAEWERARARLEASPALAKGQEDESPWQDADAHYRRYQEMWDDVRRRTEDLGLLTWPDFPIRYVPRPEWTRSAAPDLYFLFYRSPSAFHRPPIHDYLVTPYEDGPPTESVMKLNHVIHHGSIGHHVQNWHAFRAQSRIGRMAAVDCASRIALYCGGTMAEGWACYATDLMREVGFLTPAEERAELRSRMRMCVRAMVDMRLHLGEITVDEATEAYGSRAGMTPGAALGEAVKNSMFPGCAAMYLLGTDRIHALRRRMGELRGSGFDLGAFHDQFLSFGSVPVTLIAEEMEARARPREYRHEA